MTDGAEDRSDDARERLANIGEIASEIAHELRNVLQVISASAYLARHDPQAAAPHLAKIERNARVAHAIVDDGWAGYDVSIGKQLSGDCRATLKASGESQADVDTRVLKRIKAFVKNPKRQ